MGKDLKGKELGKNLIQLPNGLYKGRYTDRTGKRISKKSKKLQEIIHWLAEAEYIDEHSDVGNGTQLLVSVWFEYWLDIKKKTVRPNTVRNYSERYRSNIEPVIGKMILSEVKPIHCQKIFLKMAEEGYKTSTIYQARIALYNMFEYAYENDVIRSNPCKKSVKSDMGRPSEEKRALTLDEQRKFLYAVVGLSYENQYRFILQTGLRVGELIGLRWQDIDFANRKITIQRTMEYRASTGAWIEGPPKTKSGYREIPLTDEAAKLLERQRIKNDRIENKVPQWMDTVFLCRNGTPVKNSTYDTALYKISERTGLPHFSMHVLRHTFATRCIEAGMRPKTLQMLLGHSNIGITMNLYVHVTEDEKHKEVEKVADALTIIPYNSMDKN
ncbi:Site-specific recombinase XerD [Lachnospiraceae bacterium XPB1003]|nr:Site-specific recombinase XerD [Lachnospiraceae bacterium XPB1003]